jgi:hypothetical protein
MASVHKRTEVDGKIYNLKSDSGLHVDANEYSIEVQPDGSNTVNLFNQSIYIDYNLSRDLHKLTKLVVNLLLSNTGGSSIDLVPSNLLIDHYQLWVGKTMVDEIWAWNSFVDLISFYADSVELQYIGSVSGFNGTTFAPTTTIAAGQQLQQWVHLPTLIDTARPTYAAWPPSASIRLRIYYANGTQLYRGATTTGLNAVSTAIRQIGFMVTEEELNDARNQLRSSGELSYRFFQHRLQTTVTQALTAGIVYKTQLTSFNGDCAWVITSFRNTNPQGNAISTPILVTSHQIEDEAGRNILGINMQEDAYTRLLLAPRNCKDSVVWQQMFLYLDSWVPDLKLSYKTGARLGGRDDFKGRHYYVHNPSASQTYQIDFMPMFYAVMKISAGGNVIVDPLNNV